MYVHGSVYHVGTEVIADLVEANTQGSGLMSGTSSALSRVGESCNRQLLLIFFMCVKIPPSLQLKPEDQGDDSESETRSGEPFV